MRAIVIEHQMNVQFLFDRCIDLFQETEELLMTVFGLTLTDHGSFQNIERREQCGCSMSLVIVRLPFRKAGPGPQRKNRLRPVQRLNLTLLIHAQYDRFVRRIQVQADDVAYFAGKLRIIVGLYLNPPDKAVVLSVDEKSQIQALDRTQPILPLRPGLPERQTHDYERHGTTTLFAALNVLEGTVIGECKPRHRHQEFLKFLDRIDQSVDAELAIHLILDNYGTHKHPAVKNWLAERPRYQVHFTPPVPPGSTRSNAGLPKSR